MRRNSIDINAERTMALPNIYTILYSQSLRCGLASLLCLSVCMCVSARLAGPLVECNVNTKTNQKPITVCEQPLPRAYPDVIHEPRGQNHKYLHATTETSTHTHARSDTHPIQRDRPYSCSVSPHQMLAAALDAWHDRSRKLYIL